MQVTARSLERWPRVDDRRSYAAKITSPRNLSEGLTHRRINSLSDKRAGPSAFGYDPRSGGGIFRLKRLGSDDAELPLSHSTHDDFTDLNDGSQVGVIRDVSHDLLGVWTKPSLKRLD